MYEQIEGDADAYDKLENRNGDLLKENADLTKERDAIEAERNMYQECCGELEAENAELRKGGSDVAL
jgi:hypothetical protein